MKRIIALLLCLQIVFIIPLTASAASAGAIKIDGQNNNNEWYDYTTLMLFKSSNPGNDVDSAFMKFAFVRDNNFKLYVAAQLNPKPESYDMAGFTISVNGSDYYDAVIGNGTEMKYEIISNDELLIEGATSYDLSGGISCEFDVTVKRDTGETIDCSIGIIDGEGVSSKVNDYSLVNPFFTTTAPVEQTTAEKTTTEKTTAEKTSKTTTEKTTKEKTTKTTTEKTTKEKTTKATTEKTTKTTTEKTTKEKTTKTTTEKTTKEKTTKTTTQKTTKEKTTKTITEKTTKATTQKTTKEKKTEAEGLTTFAVTEHSRRTARSAQGKETEKTKAEKASKTTTEKKSQTKKEPEKVYVFEREVVVSDTSQTSADAASFTYTETAAHAEPASAETQIRELTDEPESSEDDGSLFGEQGLSKATKYKIIAGILAFILFTVIGVAAVRTKAEADASEEREANPESDADTSDSEE